MGLSTVYRFVYKLSRFLRSRYLLKNEIIAEWAFQAELSSAVLMHTE